MRSGSIILAASLAAAAVAYAGTALAQSPPGTTIIQPGPINRPEIGKSAEPITPPRLTGDEAEAFKRSMAAYQQCTRDKAAEIRLADSARNVIDLRDKQPFWESELKRNTTLRSQHPGGYAQMLKEGFASYRSLGGAAATIDAVRPLPSPCTNPWESYRGPQAPLEDTRQMKVAP